MGQFAKYGCWIDDGTDPLQIEINCIRNGGRWTDNGIQIGMGLAYHFKQFIMLTWPHIKFHRWLDMAIEEYCQHRGLVMIGPASSGKTSSAALCALVDYYCWPECTTILVCSTTRDRLEDRIFGEIKKLHRDATDRYPLPGSLIEGKQRILTDTRDECTEGRDFRNGIVGVPCLKGDAVTGISAFVGIKNTRVRLIVDEASLLPRAFVDSISNLDKNLDFKAVVLGNPKDTTDALGVIAEPDPTLGGWDGGIDQTPKTKKWQCRRPDTVCLQFVGSDSPNLDGKLGIPLLTQAMIDRDVAFYGKDSLWYTMMNQGMMPRGQGSRRVITRQLCVTHQALEEPVWLDNNRIRIAGLDAAYRGVGGDRCVFCHMEFGDESSVENDYGQFVAEKFINQSIGSPERRKIIALVSTMLVPLQPQLFNETSPEDQIVKFVRKECELRAIPPENFFYDSGMRTSLVTSFSRLWSTKTNPIDCGGKPSDRPASYEIDMPCHQYYSKYVSELWYSVRLTIEARQFRGMTEDVMNEFCAREFTMVGANKIEVEPKDKVKAKTGRSPDLADCVACALEGARRLGFVIRRLDSPDKAKEDDRWKRDLRRRNRDLIKSHSLNYAA